MNSYSINKNMVVFFFLNLTKYIITIAFQLKWFICKWGGNYGIGRIRTTVDTNISIKIIYRS